MSRGAGKKKKFECRLLKQIQHLNSRLTETLGSDAAALCRVGSPVIVLQHMHYLKHRAHSADGVVDGCRANELCGEVRVQGELYLWWRHKVGVFILSFFFFTLYFLFIFWPMGMSVVEITVRIMLNNTKNLSYGGQDNYSNICLTDVVDFEPNYLYSIIKPSRTRVNPHNQTETISMLRASGLACQLPSDHLTPCCDSDRSQSPLFYLRV